MTKRKENGAILSAVLELIKARSRFEGTAPELLSELEACSPASVTQRADFPRSQESVRLSEISIPNFPTLERCWGVRNIGTDILNTQKKSKELWRFE